MGRSDDSELAGFDPSLCIACGIRKHEKDSIYCAKCRPQPAACEKEMK